MRQPSETPEQVDLDAGPTGCGSESLFGTWRADETESQALAGTRIGRLVLRARALLERMVAPRPRR
ncbi:MAG: hypothetical protein HY901_22825 [Deltaproteobacteria bacterium]|nr:hypothetical protein [Deltaproteobacteria bacterium]